MTSNTTKTLEQRISAIEDYIAIIQLIAAYGPAADSFNWDALTQIWAPDTVYEVGGRGVFSGYEALKAEYESDFHQALMAAGSGHTSTVPHVVIDGDRAVATHHGILYKQEDGKYNVVRLIASQWELEKREGSWIAIRRTNELLKENAKARELLSRVFEGPAPRS